MPTLVRAVLVVVLVLVLLVALLWALQRQLYYFPDTSDAPNAASMIDGARDITLRTTDELELGAWYVPAKDNPRELTVLVANGNGGNRTDRAPLARALSAAGFDVLLFDYRGYGGNPGSPSAEGLARDARAAYRFLTDELGVSPDRLVYFGESLGTGVVTELATRYPPAALLLRSPFVNLAAVGRQHYPWLPVGFMLRDRFPVAEHVRRISAPTTIVYGTDDAIVPPAQSRRVAELAGASTRVVAIPGAGHNDAVMIGGEPIVEAVVNLASRID